MAPATEETPKQPGLPVPAEAPPLPGARAIPSRARKGLMGGRCVFSTACAASPRWAASAWPFFSSGMGAEEEAPPSRGHFSSKPPPPRRAVQMVSPEPRVPLLRPWSRGAARACPCPSREGDPPAGGAMAAAAQPGAEIGAVLVQVGRLRPRAAEPRAGPNSREAVRQQPPPPESLRSREDAGGPVARWTGPCPEGTAVQGEKHPTPSEEGKEAGAGCVFVSFNNF